MAEAIKVHQRPSDAIDLKCGHWTDQPAAVVFSNGRRLYTCIVGCGLQERAT